MTLTVQEVEALPAGSRLVFNSGGVNSPEYDGQVLVRVDNPQTDFWGEVICWKLEDVDTQVGVQPIIAMMQADLIHTPGDGPYYSIEDITSEVELGFYTLQESEVHA